MVISDLVQYYNKVVVHMQERLNSSALASIPRHHALSATAAGHPAGPEGLGCYCTLHRRVTLDLVIIRQQMSTRTIPSPGAE